MKTPYSFSSRYLFQPAMKTYEVHVEYWCRFDQEHKRKYLHYFADNEEQAKQFTYHAMGSMIEILSIEEI